MSRKPSGSYAVLMVFIALISICSIGFSYFTDIISLRKASLITCGIGSLIYYHSLPIIAKRANYLGTGPNKQLVNVNLFPYIVFVLVCSIFGGYGWYANV